MRFAELLRSRKYDAQGVDEEVHRTSILGTGKIETNSNGFENFEDGGES